MVIALEKEAELKRLPQSVLSPSKTLPITALDDTIYQLVLPRLVALIDRTEMFHPARACSCQDIGEHPHTQAMFALDQP
jgi:hypothetical protein